MIRRIVNSALLFALLALAPRPALAEDVSQRLAKGEIIAVSVPNASFAVQPGRAVAILDAAPQLVYQVLVGIPSYKSFIPRVTESRLVKDNRYIVELDLPWPVNKTWAYVQLQTGVRAGAYVITWRMLNGTLKAYDGAAWVQPWGNGKSLLTYQMLAVPHTAAPNGMMTSGLRDAVTDVVAAVRKRVAEVQTSQRTRVAAQPSRTN